MPLNLSAGGDADFTPYIKFNAKAGRFYVKGQNGDVEVEKPRLIFDFANIKTGWLFYPEGAGPEKVWDVSATEAAPRPKGPQKWKRGFEVVVVGGDKVDGIGRLGAREFSSTASNVISAILQMYNAYEEGMGSNIGKVPFYVCQGVRPITGHFGTNYEPIFKLTGWVERSKVPDLAATDAKPKEPADENWAATHGPAQPPKNEDIPF